MVVEGLVYHSIHQYEVKAEGHGDAINPVKRVIEVPERKKVMAIKVLTYLIALVNLKMCNFQSST